MARIEKLQAGNTKTAMIERKQKMKDLAELQKKIREGLIVRRMTLQP